MENEVRKKASQEQRSYAAIVKKIHQKSDKKYGGLDNIKVSDVLPVRLEDVEALNNDAAQDWLTHHGHIPQGFENLNPRQVKGNVFHAVQLMLAGEGEVGKGANQTAFYTAHLFRSLDRILHYLERWGQPNEQPLFNLVKEINPPSRQVYLDLKDWGDAVLQQGPEMAKLYKFAHKISKPCHASDYRSYHLKETRSAVLSVAYTQAYQNPELAGFCNRFILPETTYEDAVKVVTSYQKRFVGFFPQKDVPDIKIEGADFGLDGYNFRKLKDGDVKALFIGNITDCCQHIGHEKGKESVEHAYTSNEGGIYVVEDKKGNVVAHSWAWRGQQGELVLDSLEAQGNRVSAENWQKLCVKFATALDQNQTRHNVQKLHVGTGGRTPVMDFNRASDVASPKDYGGYRSSAQQYQIWQRP